MVPLGFEHAETLSVALLDVSMIPQRRVASYAEMIRELIKAVGDGNASGRLTTRRSPSFPDRYGTEKLLITHVRHVVSIDGSAEFPASRAD